MKFTFLVFIINDSFKIFVSLSRSSTCGKSYTVHMCLVKTFCTKTSRQSITLLLFKKINIYSGMYIETCVSMLDNILFYKHKPQGLVTNYFYPSTDSSKKKNPGVLDQSRDTNNS